MYLWRIKFRWLKRHQFTVGLVALITIILSGNTFWKSFLEFKFEWNIQTLFAIIGMIGITHKIISALLIMSRPKIAMCMAAFFLAILLSIFLYWLTTDGLRDHNLWVIANAPRIIIGALGTIFVLLKFVYTGVPFWSDGPLFDWAKHQEMKAKRQRMFSLKRKPEIAATVEAKATETEYWPRRRAKTYL